jgi:hypothetical protein
MSIGNRESTSIPNCPGNAPKPSASFRPPTVPSLSRSNPLGTPVLDGAVKACGYSMGAAPFWPRSR